MGSFKCTWMKFLVSLKFGWVSLLRRRTRCNNTAVESSSIGDAFGCSLRFSWVGLQRSRARCSRWKWRWGWLPCTSSSSASSAAMHQCTSSSRTAMHQNCHAPLPFCCSTSSTALSSYDSPHPLCIHPFYNALYDASYAPPVLLHFSVMCWTAPSPHCCLNTSNGTRW